MRRDPYRRLIGLTPVSILPQRAMAGALHPPAWNPDVAGTVPVIVTRLPDQHDRRPWRRRNPFRPDRRHGHMVGVEGTATSQEEQAQPWNDLSIVHEDHLNLTRLMTAEKPVS